MSMANVRPISYRTPWRRLGSLKAFANGRLCHVAILICCAAALISSCATPEGPKSVLVPVPVGCVPESVVAAPKFSTNQELANMSDHALIFNIAAEWLELKAYVSLVAPVIEACR